MPATKKFTITLTKDELTILHYVVPYDNHGDPLKDTYELGDDEPQDPYKALASLRSKLDRLIWA